MIIPDACALPHGLGQLPEKLGRSSVQPVRKTESSRTQSGTIQGGPRHDHWAKLGQVRYTRSQYSPVMIALFSMEFIAPPSRKKELRELRSGEHLDNCLR